MAEYDEITDEDMRAAARLWLSHDDWQKRLRRAVDDKAPGHLRRHHEEIPARLMELGADEEEGISPRGARRMEAMSALEYAEFGWQRDGDLLDRMAEVMTDTIKGYVDKRMQAVFRPEELSAVTLAQVAPLPVTSAPDHSPLISEHVEEWLAYIQNPTEEGEKAIPFLHAKQKGVTVRILIELVGDRPAATITRDDAKEFRKQLLRMPKSHGKGRYVHAREAIANAEAGGADLFTLKTVKRYFSALNGYWKWLRDRKFIPDAPSPFSGHSFPGTKSSRSNRDDWSVRDLERLFKSADYRGYAWDSADHWLPLIALHSGMRLEEIARLRTDHDVIFEGKVPCFKIQIHPDGWDPKTEAGEREIPVHPWLIKHGFLRLVEQRRKEGAHRLFRDLSNEGVTGTYGAEFSKRFSNLKIGLGIGKKTVFHSFRHTFRTEVDGEDIEERFIDAVMGHEGKRSEGATYRKRAALRKRQQVVESFRSPLPLDFLDAEWAPVRPMRTRKVRLEPRVTA
ncbi:MAG: site-specific integrase [Mesorhizobium sp.]